MRKGMTAMAEIRPEPVPRAAGFVRRQFLRATAAGLGGVAAWRVLGDPAAQAAVPVAGPAAARVPSGTGWLSGSSVSGGAAPGFDESARLTSTTPPRATNGGLAGQRGHTVYVFGTTVDIAANKTVEAVTLPAGGVIPAGGPITGMHLFAVGIGV